MFPARSDFSSPVGGSAWYRITLPEGERIVDSQWDALVRRFQAKFVALMAKWPYSQFVFNPWTATGQPAYRAIAGMTHSDAWHTIGSVQNRGLFDVATLDALGFIFTLLPESFPHRDDTIWRLWRERQEGSISLDTVRDMLWATDFVQPSNPLLPVLTGFSPMAAIDAVGVPADAIAPRYNARVPSDPRDADFVARFEPSQEPPLPPSRQIGSSGGQPFHPIMTGRQLVYGTAVVLGAIAVYGGYRILTRPRVSA